MAEAYAEGGIRTDRPKIYFELRWSQHARVCNVGRGNGPTQSRPQSLTACLALGICKMPNLNVYLSNYEP